MMRPFPILFALACAADPKPSVTDSPALNQDSGKPEGTDGDSGGNSSPDSGDGGEGEGSDGTDGATDTVPGDSAAPGDSAPTGDSAAPTDSASSGDSAVDTASPAPPTAEECFADLWDGAAPVDYDQFFPLMGSHCQGTNHQDISGVERVVFIGDSITLGSPPTATDDWYRNLLADELAARFALESPGWDWENVNLLDGVVYTQESGDFASCAKYGARTDDLLLDPHRQVESCLPEEQREKVTLVVMTIGGNDIYSLLEDIRDGVDEATLRATYTEATQLLRDAVTWIKEPGRFPNGVYVLFANTYDFTDGNGAEDMGLCPGAELIGLDEPLYEPLLWDILGEAQEEYLSIAVDTQSDLAFLGEQFCGHGYNSDDIGGRCYRGPGAALYLDYTCMHPSTEGHAAIADMMLAIIDE
jgi:lysophospholipase L1-like esterase